MKSFLLLSIVFYSFCFLACKNNKPETKIEKIKPENVEFSDDEVAKIAVAQNKNCFKESDTTKLQNYYNEFLNICISDTVKIKKHFTSKVKEHYIKSFCILIQEAEQEREGQLSIIILDEPTDCRGVITINSVGIYVDDEGEKHRNEYATIIYVTKLNDVFLIDEIGGAG